MPKILPGSSRSRKGRIRSVTGSSAFPPEHSKVTLPLYVPGGASSGTWTVIQNRAFSPAGRSSDSKCSSTSGTTR